MMCGCWADDGVRSWRTPCRRAWPLRVQATRTSGRGRPLLQSCACPRSGSTRTPRRMALHQSQKGSRARASRGQKRPHRRRRHHCPRCLCPSAPTTRHHPPTHPSPRRHRRLPLPGRRGQPKPGTTLAGRRVNGGPERSPACTPRNVRPSGSYPRESRAPPDRARRPTSPARRAGVPSHPRSTQRPGAAPRFRTVQGSQPLLRR
mmetsp:Transcript_106778/g.309769  ORF Transcript_106778/g.309769 Transcript_106778/m.309769 type:complete len:204 (-) Transcript_106778:270-881(-)